MTKDEIQRLALSICNSKIKTGDNANFGEIYGLNEDDVAQMMSETVQTLSVRIERSGSVVTSAVVDTLSDVVYGAVLCAVTDIKESQKASAQAINAAMQANFVKLAGGIGGFADKLFAEIERQQSMFGGVEAGLKRLSDSYNNQAGNILRQLNDIQNKLASLDDLPKRVAKEIEAQRRASAAQNNGSSGGGSTFNFNGGSFNGCAIGPNATIINNHNGEDD